MFPGYVFVNAELGRMRWRSIDSAIGVLKYYRCVEGVRFGDMQAALPTGLVDNFEIQAGEDGSLEWNELFEIGDVIRDISGAFEDWIGQIVNLPDGDWVKVPLSMMTPHVEVTLSRKQLTKSG